MLMRRELSEERSLLAGESVELTLESGRAAAVYSQAAKPGSRSTTARIPASVTPGLTTARAIDRPWRQVQRIMVLAGPPRLKVVAPPVQPARPEAMAPGQPAPGSEESRGLLTSS